MQGELGNGEEKGRLVCDWSTWPASLGRRMASLSLCKQHSTQLNIQLGLQILYISKVESFLEFTLAKGSPDKTKKQKL